MLEWLTLVLVSITGFYAWQTYRMTEATAAMVEVAREALQDERAARLREKSDSAARSCLRALWDLESVIRHRGPGAITMDDCRATYEVLSTEGQLINDPLVRDRVQSCALVAFTAGWSDQGLATEGVSRGKAGLNLSLITSATSATLGAHLREESLPSWLDDLPAESTGAQAWLIERSRTGA